VIETSDGGLVLTGYTDSYSGNSDVFLAKFTSYGVLEWAQTLEGSKNSAGISMVESSAGELVITGVVDNHGLFLAKYTTNGTLLWANIVENDNSGWYTSGSSVIEIANDPFSNDGGLVVTGQTVYFPDSQYSYLVLFKFTSNGTLVWAQTFGGDYQTSGTSVIEMSNGWLAVTGTTTSDGAQNSDMLLAQIPNNGTTECTVVMTNFTYTELTYPASIIYVAFTTPELTFYQVSTFTTDTTPRQTKLCYDT